MGTVGGRMLPLGWRGGNVAPINDRLRTCAWKRAAVLDWPLSSLGCRRPSLRLSDSAMGWQRSALGRALTIGGLAASIVERNLLSLGLGASIVGPSAPIVGQRVARIRVGGVHRWGSPCPPLSSRHSSFGGRGSSASAAGPIAGAGRPSASVVGPTMDRRASSMSLAGPNADERRPLTSTAGPSMGCRTQSLDVSVPITKRPGIPFRHI